MHKLWGVTATDTAMFTTCTNCDCRDRSIILYEGLDTQGNVGPGRQPDTQEMYDLEES